MAVYTDNQKSIRKSQVKFGILSLGRQISKQCTLQRFILRCLILLKLCSNLGEEKRIIKRKLIVLNMQLYARYYGKYFEYIH